jgi:hypothetical protein
MRLFLLLLLGVAFASGLTAREDADIRNACSTKVCNGIKRKDLRACLRQCYTEKLQIRLHKGKGTPQKVIPHIKSPPKPRAKIAPPRAKGTLRASTQKAQDNMKRMLEMMQIKKKKAPL